METINHEIIRAVLKVIFGHEYRVEMYGCIDDDKIPKTAIQIMKTKEYENGDNVYSVSINWRLLDKAIEQIEKGARNETD